MRKIPVTAAALSISLLLASAPEAMAASATNKTTTTKPTAKETTKKPVVHTLANLSAVKITAKSTVSLTDVNILTQDEESILTYTLTIKNGDNKPLDLLDYWSKVKTASGTSYSTSLMSKDKDKKKLSAGSSTTLTYVAKVGKDMKISNLVFQVVKWDFSQPGYEALKGQFKVPANYLTSTPADQSKTIRISDVPVKAMVKQVAAYTSGDYNYVSVGLNLQNIGYRIFEDPKVKFVIKTSNGASYPMSADSTSTEYKIQPQDNKTLNLMTAIPKSIKLTNMELQWVQDDETAKMSLPVATMQLPGAADKSLATEANEEKSISLGSGKITASVSGMTMNQSFDEHDLSVRVLLRNTSGTTVTLPKYQFELQTSDGYRLPISSSAIENVVLQPLEEKVFSLAVTIPANVKADNSQLFMNLPSASDSKDNFKYPVAIFTLPESQPVQNMIGQKQYVQTGKGIVGFELSSLQRLPWSDGDQVAAKITISNTGSKTILLPELLGQIKIDSAKLTADTKLITSQSVGLLGANSSTDVYIISKVPSNIDFSQLQISLLEKVGEGSSEWMQFSHAGALPELTTITSGSSYEIDTSGRKQELKVLRSFVYTGTSSDLIYAELEEKNMEDHQIDLSQITGSFKASGGQTYKATVSQIDTSAGPEEKSVVALWAKIPKKVSTTDMKLVVGEGITDNKMTPIKGVPTGYVNAAALELNISTPNVRGNLADLDLFPYSLTVRDVRATLSGSTSVSLTFDYSQNRNMEYAIGEFGHKYLFEVVDSSNRTFEKEFIPETDLKLSKSASASFSFDDIVFDKRQGGTFQLNIYDLFQGQKVKLGSQGFYYLSSNYDKE
ncbi:DUF4832 domain-containing protein [Paenibacillus segetis]|uniref:Uncharacterized protein n=1 Tax=Paenibacillus segetis TaxID=1325360 RepID=A0ABQ1YQ39_9BACL|nr:DUF4832 domain-containing protein [Paenibacillus segetis]GGH32895.1 hypothetical protein GCM10008013_37590 [Paenibacillus segetis]